jgi:hypothetical protein
MSHLIALCIVMITFLQCVPLGVGCPTLNALSASIFRAYYVENRLVRNMQL